MPWTMAAFVGGGLFDRRAADCGFHFQMHLILAALEKDEKYCPANRRKFADCRAYVFRGLKLASRCAGRSGKCC